LYTELIALEKDPPKLYQSPSAPSYPTEKDLVNNPDRWDVKGEANPDSQNLTGSVAYGNPCDNLNSNDPNSRTSKEARYAIIVLEENKAIQNNLLQGITKDNKKVAIDKFQNERNDLVNQFAKEFITECDYFEAIKRNQPFVYTSLQEKIKGFHPAFHSMTPEGLNSRLTFLNQCTRQGPQILDSTKPQNMVFGRPPICVLRIGDFYNTKIVVDSVNISYDPLQWDLNPEGIGVQPMLAKVTMSFKFIGGSSLGGPIKQLQNAVSYNFYANTGVYQPWKYTEEIINQKQRFIYGAFMSPEDAETAYGNINSSLGVVQDVSVKQNLESVNTTAILTDATASSGVTSATQAGMPTSTNGTTPETTSNPSDDLLTITVSNTNESDWLIAEITEKGKNSGWKITEKLVETTVFKPVIIIYQNFGSTGILLETITLGELSNAIDRGDSTSFLEEGDLVNPGDTITKELNIKTKITISNGSISKVYLTENKIQYTFGQGEL